MRKRFIVWLWDMVDRHVSADPVVHEDTGAYYYATRGRYQVYIDQEHNHEETCINMLSRRLFVRLTWMFGDYSIRLERRSSAWAQAEPYA